MQFGKIWTKEVGPENVVILPYYIRLPRNITIYDTCNEIENILPFLPPSIWNNSSLNPCENYFCGNGTISNDTSIHYGLQRYCAQCFSSSSQNFTSILNSRNCSNFDREICNGRCAATSVCIYYDYPLCYHFDGDNFVGRDDYVHNNVIYFNSVTRLYIQLPICILIFIFELSLFIYPEIFLCYKGIKKSTHLGFFDKLKVIFSLRSQVRINVFIMGISWIVAILLDIILMFASENPNTVNLFSTLVLVLEISFTFFSFNSVVTLWSHICDSVDSGDIEGPLTTKNKYF